MGWGGVTQAGKTMQKKINGLRKKLEEKSKALDESERSGLKQQEQLLELRRERDKLTDRLRAMHTKLGGNPNDKMQQSVRA